ncbi:helix-turn-helix transcriptional regulator [Mycoavidus sp. B2-EB]|uniref:helix-turn-helix transcriptional regulator n=1 Tax=Mycoavidus sp. B2-EB TaxID=2651972 RepID=UPI0016272FB3|nr:helix-turn-helix transcriptional regulator [Mycoavidus sp. B2-EB]BBO59418.1 hypothetical protein MPB2EB_0535 [Mycoavidus sp. B2-EB]
MELSAVGRMIKARRNAIGLTQQHLAKLAKLSRQTVQTLEAGTIKDLGFERLSRLLSVLGLGFDNLSLTAQLKKQDLWRVAKNCL